MACNFFSRLFAFCVRSSLPIHHRGAQTFCVSSMVILFLILSSIAEGSQGNTSPSLPPPDIAGSTFNGSQGNTSPSLPQPEKPASTLIAALDGTLYLVESASWKVIWSFSTGFPIYHSHQAPINDSNIAPEFIECGEDWELIIHDTHLGKTRLSESVEFYMSITPMECKDGSMLQSIRSTSIYTLDAKSGRLHQSNGVIKYGPCGDQPEFLLNIMRIDYHLKAIMYSGRPLWSMNVSQLKAILYCPHHEDYTLDFLLPYACGATEYKDIYRHRQPYVFESLNHSRTPQPLIEINASNEVGWDWVTVALFVTTLVAVLCSIFYLRKSKGITQTNDSHPRKIGKLFLSTTEIGKGSHGTIVYEGSFERRKVAVKRILKAHQESADKEIDNLIHLEPHQNIVRYHYMESDQDFLYLILERCSFNLDYLICTCKATLKNHDSSNDQDAAFEIFKKTNICLWKTDCSPTDQLLDLMRDVVSGLAHLHKKEIVHRDLKPQNVLIMIEDQSLCAKLSDMGMSKKLTVDKSSYSTTGCGTRGWQAPEVIGKQRQTQATDLFSLGCLIFFCVTRGEHPFGKDIERDTNIVKDNKKLSKVYSYPEIEHIIIRLLDPAPEQRPEATKVLLHPIFWKSDKRLRFIHDVSERVENGRQHRTAFFTAIENLYPVVVDKTRVNWDTKIDQALVNDLLSRKGYQFNRVSHLLRAIRNKESHYNELPQNLKSLLGSFPDGLDDYFSSRFPKLFIEVYKTTHTHLKGDADMQRYFKFF